MFFMTVPTVALEGQELDTVEITLRLGKANLEKLTTGRGVACMAVWLSQQPDGSYALGLKAATRPEHPRKVERDDRRERGISP